MTSTAAQPARIPDEVREGEYGTRVAAVEPGGAEFIPLAERHGRPLNLFWTWTSPNFEFATIFVGALPLLFFGETFAQAALAIVLGTGLGALAMAFLSARGPEHGVPQMILSRISFGRFGNVLPAGINALVAGVGWFAVNSVSGTLALSALTGWAEVPCLLLITVVQITVAFFGHNLVHTFEKLAFPLLAVVFVVVSVILLAESHPSAPTGGGGIGGFLLTLGATFGYAAGWNPYAADYTRYLKKDENKKAVGLWAGLGVFVSCVLLELAGTAAATLVVPDGLWDEDPTAAFITHITPWLGDVTLVAIAVGAVCANALNVYSGAMSFLALGIKIPLTARRALVALVFGLAGFFLAWSGLSDAGTKYNNFLLVIAYWIGPWLGVYLVDQLLRRGQNVHGLLFSRSHKPIAGVLAMAGAMAVSIPLFSNQTDYVGALVKNHPGLGDLTFEVGFVLAGAFYWLLFKYLPSSLGRGDATEPVSEPADAVPDAV